MKIITFYLPQFHTFPENDMWWGKGFTEWTNTKKAMPLFEGHYQPHTPLHEDYYDLANPDVMINQIKTAKKYGIYGFCFYHYWFKDGKKLMEKPVEMFLKNKNMDMNFCLCWANEHWTRAWDGGNKQVIMEQEYGKKEDWEKHFNYMLPFFKDRRYILEDGKPMLLIYKPEDIPNFDEMVSTWKKLAKDNGLKGLFVMAQGSNYCMTHHTQEMDPKLDACIMYEPGYTYASIKKENKKNFLKYILEYRKFTFHYILPLAKSYLCRKLKIRPKKPTDIMDFSVIWETILSVKIPKNYYPGAFANWDNTARRGIYARIIQGTNPKIFEKYFTKQLIRAREEYKKNYLFFTAWNEWAEGSHLEPDEKYGYGYLEAVSKALRETKEWPEELKGEIV